jgi:integrase
VRWGHVDLAGKALAVIGKGEKPAVIGLPPQLVEHLFQWKGMWAAGAGRVPQAEECVLVALNNPQGIGQERRSDPRWGVGIGVDAIGRLVGRAGIKAGLGKLEPHDLRRTFAGILEDRGTPIEDISKALRHSNITTTQKYLEQNPRRTIAVTEGLVLDL